MVFGSLLSLASRVAPKLISGVGEGIKAGAEAFQRGSGFLGALKSGAKRFGVSVLDTAAEELPALGGLLNPLRSRLVDTREDTMRADATKVGAPVIDTARTPAAAPEGFMPSPAAAKASTPSRSFTMSRDVARRSRASRVGL